MGTPEPPEDQTSAVDEEIDEVTVDPQEEASDGGGGGEKPESHWGG